MTLTGGFVYRTISNKKMIITLCYYTRDTPSNVRRIYFQLYLLSKFFSANDSEDLFISSK